MTVTETQWPQPFTPGTPAYEYADDALGHLTAACRSLNMASALAPDHADLRDARIAAWSAIGSVIHAAPGPDDDLQEEDH